MLKNILHHDDEQRRQAITHWLTIAGVFEGRCDTTYKDAEATRIYYWISGREKPRMAPYFGLTVCQLAEKLQDYLGTDAGLAQNGLPYSASITNHKLGRWHLVATEWDLDPETARIAQCDPLAWLDANKDADLEKVLDEAGISVVWAWSGSKSFYAYTFFRQGLSQKAADQVRAILEALIPSRAPDLNLRHNGAPIPLGFHRRTHEPCLLAGAPTMFETARAMVALQPCGMSEAEVLAAIRPLTPLLPPAPAPDPVLSKPDSPGLVAFKSKSPKNGGWLESHPYREVYESALQHGWAKGETNDLLFGRGRNGLWVYTLAKSGLADVARAQLIAAARLGVDDDTWRDRKARIETLVPPAGWIEKQGPPLRPVLIQGIIIQSIVQALTNRMKIDQRPAKLIKGLARTAQWMLEEIALKGDVAQIGIGYLMAHLKIAKATAVKHRDLLRNNYPVFRLKPYGHNRFWNQEAAQAMRFRLNIPFVENDLGLGSLVIVDNETEHIIRDASPDREDQRNDLGELSSPYRMIGSVSS